MKQLKARDLKAFCEAVRRERSINLPGVATNLGYDFFKQIKPEIESNEKFREQLSKVLEELKYELTQRVLEAALNGRPKNRPAPEISYIKAITQIIDSGTLLGVKPRDNDGGSDGSDDIEEHKKRLGL